jgi:hypothetical protein
VTWSYSTALSTDIDRVRLLIGDIDTSDPLPLQNEEIQYLLTLKNGSLYDAAIASAERLAAFYARKVTKSVGSLSIQYSNKYKQFQELADRLRNEAMNASAASGLFVAPFAGGISKTTEQTYEEDPDRIQPAFSRRTHEDITVVPPTTYWE